MWQKYMIPIEPWTIDIQTSVVMSCAVGVPCGAAQRDTCDQDQISPYVHARKLPRRRMPAWGCGIRLRTSFALHHHSLFSVTISAHRDRSLRIHLDSYRPGPAADLAILHQHVFAGLEISRLDLDDPRLAAERTFDLENHRFSLTDRIASAQKPALEIRWIGVQK
jgi:hypothetical protein